MRTAARATRRTVWSSLLGLLCVSLPIARQALSSSEGSLNNDAFLPTSKQAAELLERGDTSIDEAATVQERLLAFEAWRSALTASKTGDSIEVSGRETIGVEVAVERRLRALSSDHRKEWAERFDELAREEFKVAGHSKRSLSGVARRNPGTTASVHASLRLADLELERGAALECAEWCRRALHQLELTTPALSTAEETKLRRAIDARRQIAQDLGVADAGALNGARTSEPWELATELKHISRVDFETSVSIPNPRNLVDPGPPTGLRPGLAFLDDGRIAIQSATRITIVKPNGRSIESSFEPTLLLPDSLWILPPRSRRGDNGAWHLNPAVSGDQLILVHGRPTRPGRNNALIALRPPVPQRGLGVPVPALPQLNWAIVGATRVDSKQRLHPEPKLESLEDAAFEAGPIVVGAHVFATLRQTEGEVRAWLACFDLATGECLWTRLLAQGTAFQPGLESMGARRPAIPALPLSAEGTKLFAGTNLGAALAFDVLDGRHLWGFKNRRRAAGDEVWRGNWAPDIARGSKMAGTVLWAPLDSDHEYRLSLESEAGPLVGSPRPIGEALALIGGDEDHSIVLSLAGSRRVVSSRRNSDGARFDSPYLGREENFRGAGAISEARVLFSSDRGLYLLDRTRELYLLDYVPFPSTPLPLGGEVMARGSKVFVLSEASLWTFSAR